MVEKDCCNGGDHPPKKYKKIYFEEITEEANWAYADIPDIYSKIGKDEILALLKKLPESLYLVFNLYVIEGYQHNEIAEMLGITESTSRAALCKARNRLTDILKNQNEHMWLMRHKYIDMEYNKLEDHIANVLRQDQAEIDIEAFIRICTP
jgi:predicted DNA-binding protein YlxM (UPF0122 family)